MEGYSIVPKINDYAAKISGKATFVDAKSGTPNSGASDVDNVIPGGLITSIAITDAFSIESDDTFDEVAIALIDNAGTKTTAAISTAGGNVTINDGTDSVDLTLLPIKVQLVVKTTKAPEGKEVNFWITAE